MTTQLPEIEDRKATTKKRWLPFARKTQPRALRNGRGSDVLVAAMGIALGLGCALFPWYVFFNQEQFGVRAMRFSGEGGRLPASVSYQPELVVKPITAADAPTLQLDLLPTGTLGDGDGPEAVPLSQQPFPGQLLPYRLIHVENGRAMIEDENGLWVVQRGSHLPDNSKVASIEKHGEEWVIVTTADEIVKLAQ